MKRLGLIAVRDVEVEPGAGPAGPPVVSDDQTMRQALDVLLTTGCDVAVVTGVHGEAGAASSPSSGSLRELAS